MKSFLKFGLLLVVVAHVAACGGGGTDWDEFRPRAAVVSDLENRTLEFDWLPTGNPLDAGVGLMTLGIGDFDQDEEASFSVEEDGKGEASGEVEFDSPNLTFRVTEVTGSISLEVGQTIEIEAEADVDDGRIQLTNHATSASATSK